MALSTYSELQAAISSFAGGSSAADFTDAIKTSVALCEADIERNVRCAELVQRRIGPIDDAWEMLPDDFRRMISLSLITDCEERALGQVGEDRMPAMARCLTSGSPRYYALIGSHIRLLPEPAGDGSESLRAVYFTSVPRLSDAAPTNAMLTTYPDLYLWGSLSVLGEWVEDGSRLPRFEQRYQNAVRAINRAFVLRDATLAA